MKFSEFNIPAHILEGLKKMGFEEATPIQEETFPIIAAGKDLCALAETGSGKTAGTPWWALQATVHTQRLSVSTV